MKGLLAMKLNDRVFILAVDLPFVPVAGMYVGYDWQVLITQVNYAIREQTFFCDVVWPVEYVDYDPVECLLADGWQDEEE